MLVYCLTGYGSDKTAGYQISMKQTIFGTSSSNETSTRVVIFSKKVIKTFTKILRAVLFCCSTRHHPSTLCKRLEDLPNEILLKIMTYCDFTSKMNTRALNYRFYSLIEKGAHNLPRRNLVGGVEIKHCSPNLQDNLNTVVSSSIAYPGFHLTLSRPLKHIEILVPATRLTNIMRHVCVCHSLKLCGVSLDEVLASNILDASFRTVSDVIIDHVDTVTAETLSRLVNKACPSNKLIFCNHSTRKASDAIVPELLLSCPAKNVTILPRNTLLHHNFDDAALVRLVVSDHVIRRVVRLPICAITHHGINHAAQVFYKRCCDLMEEWTTEMNAPRWEISIFFPYSIMIDRNLIKVPAEMRDQCIIWGFKSQQNNSFIVEVRVGGMNLRITVESSS